MNEMALQVLEKMGEGYEMERSEFAKLPPAPTMENLANAERMVFFSIIPPEGLEWTREFILAETALELINEGMVVPHTREEGFLVAKDRYRISPEGERFLNDRRRDHAASLTALASG